MTIEDGHFRTDGEKIEPCCKIMKSTIDDEDISFTPMNCQSHWELFGVDSQTPAYLIHGILKHGTICFWCGAKLEYVDKLDGGQ